MTLAFLLGITISHWCFSAFLYFRLGRIWSQLNTLQRRLDQSCRTPSAPTPQKKQRPRRTAEQKVKMSQAAKAAWDKKKATQPALTAQVPNQATQHMTPGTASNIADPTLAPQYDALE